MQEWTLGLAALSGISVTGFVVVAVLWLRKLREAVSSTLGESASQQVQTAQRFAEALAEVQKQQRGFERQLQTLAQSNAQLRQSLASVATQLQHGQIDVSRAEPTIH